MIEERLIGYIEKSIRQNWDKEALSNYKESGYSYKEIAEKILKIHILFKDAGIREGDKIALVGRNSANWCITYLATVTYGAVIVPVLPDFKPEDLTNIINHSDSRLLFVDEKIFESLDISKVQAIIGVISLDNFGLINSANNLLKATFSTLEEKYKKTWPELKRKILSFQIFQMINLQL